jgi:hypothetical protein
LNFSRISSRALWIGAKPAAAGVPTFASASLFPDTCRLLDFAFYSLNIPQFAAASKAGEAQNTKTPTADRNLCHLRNLRIITSGQKQIRRLRR